MKTKFFFAAILLSLTGYAFPSSDSSELATDLRNVNNFSGLIVNTTANVILSQGESNSIRIEGEKDMVKEITTTIENGALIIAGNNNHAITIYVTATDINLVEVNVKKTIMSKSDQAVKIIFDPSNKAIPSPISKAHIAIASHKETVLSHGI